MEAISPELVLVDPELARVARARLASSADISTLRHVVAVATPPAAERSRVDDALDWLRPRVMTALVGLSLAANGVLLAVVLDRHETVRVVAASPARTAEVERLPLHSVVERRLLNEAFRSPGTKLPRRFIDTRTGLPKDNLHISCSHLRARLFQCALGVGGGGEAPVVVRYRWR